jgi:hypothetical protein
VYFCYDSGAAIHTYVLDERFRSPEDLYVYMRERFPAYAVSLEGRTVVMVKAAPQGNIEIRTHVDEAKQAVTLRMYLDSAAKTKARGELIALWEREVRKVAGARERDGAGSRW